MKQAAIVASLRQIELLAAQCLEGLGESRRQASEESNPTSNLKPVAARTLPQLIVECRDEGFFKDTRTAREVHEKLLPSYACEINRVVTALRRLAEGKKLRRASKTIDKKKQIAYVW